mmetsp:Transcript_3376/g.7542  ORF Transcript_3376/g.7542 Transcript_3376/m.7542 type:complete len:216 (-) Transcript_3376:125-772(-)
MTEMLPAMSSLMSTRMIAAIVLLSRVKRARCIVRRTRVPYTKKDIWMNLRGVLETLSPLGTIRFVILLVPLRLAMGEIFVKNTRGKHTMIHLRGFVARAKLKWIPQMVVTCWEMGQGFHIYRIAIATHGTESILIRVGRMIGVIAGAIVDLRVDPVPLQVGAEAEAGVDLALPREIIEERDRPGIEKETGRGMPRGPLDRMVEEGALRVQKRLKT